MATIGTRNSLKVLRSATPGLYLDAEDLGEVLLPGTLIPKGTQIGDVLDVFLYRDSEDRLVTTPAIPHAQVGEFAYLRVVSVNPAVGVFLDWGLPKDLLLPLREIVGLRPQAGDWVVVFVMLDPRSQRIAATTKLNRHLSPGIPRYAQGEKVNVLICGETPLGYSAIVENAYMGLVYRSNMGSHLGVGERLEAYVKKIRPDRKLDLSLDEAGYQRVGNNTETVMLLLKESGGRMPFHDNSSPEEIRATFGMSKKAFKQAIGALYKERKIVIETHAIRLA